jgi:hypothetical protein
VVRLRASSPDVAISIWVLASSTSPLPTISMWHPGHVPTYTHTHTHRLHTHTHTHTRTRTHSHTHRYTHTHTQTPTPGTPTPTHTHTHTHAHTLIPSRRCARSSSLSTVRAGNFFSVSLSVQHIWLDGHSQRLHGCEEPQPVSPMLLFNPPTCM